MKRANEQLGRVEQVKAFRILDRELDPELEGEAVTPTRKIKRALLQRHFGHLIDRDVQRRRGAAHRAPIGPLRFGEVSQGEIDHA